MKTKMNRMGMRFFSSDHYAEETTRQIPSNTPFLVAQNSPTSKVYRWKTQIVTDLSTAPCKSKKFGASGEWCIKIGLVDKKFSVRLILDNRSEYLHFYLGVIVPSGQLYSASSFDDNWNLHRHILSDFMICLKKMTFSMGLMDPLISTIT